MVSEQEIKVAREDISELEKIFSQYSDIGEKVEGVASNLGSDRKTALRLLREIENECSFDLLPPLLEDSLKKSIDSLEILLQGRNDEQAYREMKESHDELKKFIDLSEEEKISRWAKTFLEDVSNYNGEEIVSQSGKFKVIDMGIRDFFSGVIYSNTGVAKSLRPGQKVAEELENYQKRHTVKYGRERHKISIAVSGNNPEMVESTAKSMLLQQLDFEQLKSEIKQVNSNISNIVEAKEAVIEGELPRYGKLYSDDRVQKMKNYVAGEMIKSVENALSININATPEDLVVKTNQEVIGYFGKNRNGKWVLHFTDEESTGTLFDLMTDTEDKSFDELVRFIESAPMGFKNPGEDHTPSKAPDVFMVDLFHETGHAVADMAAEQVFHGGEVNKNYGRLIDDELGRKVFEKAANEIAGLTLKRLSASGTGTWKSIFKGFESYLELTKYDKPVKGYRDQHPIKATQKSVRELYDVG
ncbi:MAG: hypothetical protein ACI83Q_000853 [Colwellia polaris]|jgi:hypothetical protein